MLLKNAFSMQYPKYRKFQALRQYRLIYGKKSLNRHKETSSLRFGSVSENMERMQRVSRRMSMTFCRVIPQGQCLQTPSLSLCSIKLQLTAWNLPSCSISPICRWDILPMWKLDTGWLRWEALLYRLRISFLRTQSCISWWQPNRARVCNSRLLWLCSL